MSLFQFALFVFISITVLNKATAYDFTCSHSAPIPIGSYQGTCPCCIIWSNWLFDNLKCYCKDKEGKEKISNLSPLNINNCINIVNDNGQLVCVENDNTTTFSNILNLLQTQPRLHLKQTFLEEIAARKECNSLFAQFDLNDPDLNSTSELNSTDQKNEGREKLIKLFFEIYKSCKVLQDKDYEILAKAVQEENVDAVKQLIEVGVDPNALSKEEDRVLFDLIKSNTLQALAITRFLLDFKLDPNLKSRQLANSSALHHAVLHGTAEMVELLLEYRANVDALLGVTLEKRDEEYEPELVAMSPSPEDLKHYNKNYYGPWISKDCFNSHYFTLTPLEIAAKHCSEINQPLEKALILLSYGASINRIDDKRATWMPLTYAADNRCHGLAKLLLVAKAKVNQQEAVNHHTALHRAYWNNNKEMINLLLRHGADPNIIDEHGHKPAETGKHLMLSERDFVWLLDT